MNNANSESAAGNAVIGVSVTGGLVATINEYAVIISLGLTVLGIIIGLFFHILAVKDRRKQMEIERRDRANTDLLEQRLAKLLAEELEKVKKAS